MTAEQTRLIGDLLQVLRDHRARHGCEEVEVPGAPALARFGGPVCAEEQRLLRFIGAMSLEIDSVPVPAVCAICREPLDAADALPLCGTSDQGHFRCVAAQQLAKRGGSKVSVAIGRRVGARGFTVLAGGRP